MMIELLKDNADFMSYFPDRMPKGRIVAREYFWNILNSVDAPYVAHIIQHANAARYSAQTGDAGGQAIEVTDEWVEMLTANPFISCKFTLAIIFLESKGNMIHLLKQSSKPVGTAYKRRLVSIGSTPLDFHSKQKEAAMQPRDNATKSKKNANLKLQEEKKEAPLVQNHQPLVD